MGIWDWITFCLIGLDVPYHQNNLQMLMLMFNKILVILFSLKLI